MKCGSAPEGDVPPDGMIHPRRDGASTFDGGVDHIQESNIAQSDPAYPVSTPVTRSANRKAGPMLATYSTSTTTTTVAQNATPGFLREVIVCFEFEVLAPTSAGGQLECGSDSSPGLLARHIGGEARQ